MEQTDFEVIDPETYGGDQATQVTQRLLEDHGQSAEPEIGEAPDGEVELALGLLDASGTRHTTAEVTEMTGEVEEALARPAVRKNYGKFLTELLHSCTKSIGSHEPPSKEDIRSLSNGDRDLLAVAIRKATYGSTFDLTVTCPQCRHEFEVVYDLDADLPVKRPEEPQEIFTVELRRGRKAEVRLPNGFDQELLGGDRSRSIPETNHMLLGQCVQSLDGQPVLGTANIKTLGMVDIRSLLEAIDEHVIGPQFSEVSQDCPNCNNEFPLAVNLVELFRG